MAVDDESILPPHKSEAGPQFQQKFLQMFNQTGFQFTFAEARGEGEEVEEVRIFKRLLGKFRIGRRQAQ